MISGQTSSGTFNGIDEGKARLTTGQGRKWENVTHAGTQSQQRGTFEHMHPSLILLHNAFLVRLSTACTDLLCFTSRDVCLLDHSHSKSEIQLLRFKGARSPFSNIEIKDAGAICPESGLQMFQSMISESRACCSVAPVHVSMPLKTCP